LKSLFFCLLSSKAEDVILQRGRVFLTAGAANEKKEKFENEHSKTFLTKAKADEKS
jgi:hypothetical protein